MIVRYSRRLGIIRMLDWLEMQPGANWQDRWQAGAEQAADRDWRDIAELHLKDTGRIAAGNRSVWRSLGGALGLLIGCDVIPPQDLGWLLTSATPAHLAADMARVRDPHGFAALERAAGKASVSVASTRRAMLQVAVMMAVKGGMAGDHGRGLPRAAGDPRPGSGATGITGERTSTSCCRAAAGFFPAGAPPRARMLDPRVHGQKSAGQLVDRYGLACRPVRDLLVDYLNERRPGIDYVTLGDLAYQLGLLFWKDLETHHPGIDSLDLAPDVAVAWKQRLQFRTVETTAPGGKRTQAQVPRLSVVDHLTTVRSFYLDIAEWAADDPSRWAQWAVPCPVRPAELTHRQALTRRKSRMDQRTRERLPVMPALLAHVRAQHTATPGRLAAAAAAAPGELFTSGDATLRRTVTSVAGKRSDVWAEDPASGVRADLTAAEDNAFWTWACTETLNETGIRVEELGEISHHSLIQYRDDGTGEVIPLLHVVPSKTDQERLVVISPVLTSVLSAVISRIRDGTGAVPCVRRYDRHERKFDDATVPLLFQRRFGVENRPIPYSAVRLFLEKALAAAGITDVTGQPLTMQPHDFRRIFITEAISNGMPPHICQLLAGHKDINVTMNYNTIYPQQAINAHRDFIARRRALRPADEYRPVTDAEWNEFRGHFARRKVALGDCGRASAKAASTRWPANDALCSASIPPSGPAW